MKSYSENQHGATLFELIGALLVSAILLGTAFTVIPQALSSFTLKSATKALERDLQHFAVLAQSTRSKTWLILDSESYQGYSSFELILHRNLPSQVSLATRSTISFYPSGAASPATIEVVQGERRCKVVVSLRARTRITC